MHACAREKEREREGERGKKWKQVWNRETIEEKDKVNIKSILKDDVKSQHLFLLHMYLGKNKLYMTT